MQNFINGETTPHPRVRRKIALWYLESVQPGAAPESAHPPAAYGSAVTTLLDGIEPARHDAARGDLLEALAVVHSSHGPGTPAWLADLRGG